MFNARHAVLLVGLLLPGMAKAQATGSFDAPSGRRTDITLNGRLRYDTNVLRGLRVTDASGARGGAGGDEIFSPSATFDVARPVGRQSVFLGGSAGYDFYRRNTRLNRERIQVDGGALLSGFGGCSGGVTGSYARRQSEFADLIDALGNTITPINVETVVTYGANVSCGRAIGLRPGFSYMHNSATNSYSNRRLSDVRGDTYRASLNYVRPSFGVLSLYGSYYDGRYPNRSGVINGIALTDGIKVYSYGVSYQRQLGSRIRGDVSLGGTHVKPNAPTVPDFTGVSYSAAINYRASDRLSASFSASRQPQQSNLLNISYSISDAYSAGVTYALSSRLRLQGGAALSRRKFQDTPLLPGTVLRGNDRTLSFNGGVGYSLRRLRFGLDAAHRNRGGGAGVANYSNTSLTFSTSLTL